jgi:putative membrane protein
MMINGLCQVGNLVSLGTYGAWGGIVLMILNMVFWLGVFAALSLLIVWAIRRARVAAVAVQEATGQPSTKDVLQARYARGEITRDQYERMKQDVG